MATEQNYCFMKQIKNLTNIFQKRELFDRR